MVCRGRLTMVFGLLGMLALNLQAGSDPTAADEKVLKGADLKTDGDSLLDFLRRRTLPDNEREKYRTYTRQLGSDIYRVREQAMAELTARGPVVIELLREAARNTDLETMRRAERCIQRIKEKDVGSEVVATVVRVLGHRKPAPTVETLLAFLPFADADLVSEEVRNVLGKLAATEEKARPLLVAALTDTTPVRRAAAGEALVRGGKEESRQAVRPLLADPSPLVRLRVSLALTLNKDKEAVQVLIETLPGLTLNQAWAAEDVLYRLAEGKSPPAVSLGSDEAARVICRDAWLGWWKKNKDVVDLAKLHESERLTGATIVVMLDLGRVLEVGPDPEREIRWQINELRFPLDVQALPGDRVLVAEYHAGKVTERDTTGKILWEKAIQGPLMAQRLPNGNTFIATDEEFLEFDRADKEVYHVSLPAGEKIMKAMKLASGEIACLSSNSRIVRLDSTGKVLHSFEITLGTRLFGGRIHMLPSGRVLIPHNNENKVVEYDATGKAIWEVAVDQPVAAVRLSNGHTLVTSMLPQRGAVEFDRQGNELWTYRTTTRVTRALRR